MKKEVSRFLYESNAIEREYSVTAFKDAVVAWEYINDFEKISIPTILKTHEELMRRQNERIAGKLRSVDVMVGGRTCPPWQNVSGLLNEWVKNYVDFFELYSPATIDDIKNAHIEFEKIHPFEDGNGRIGRIIMNWQMLQHDLPILIIHEGEEQMKYYEWFKD